MQRTADNIMKSWTLYMSSKRSTNPQHELIDDTRHPHINFKPFLNILLLVHESC